MISFSVPSGPAAASEARRRLAASDSLVPSSVGQVLLLLTTELVTNAVRHGGASHGGSVEVTVARSPGRLTVAVTDPGPGFEWAGRNRSRSPDTGGFGLLLVERMAQRWGIERDHDSTTVWFELVHSGFSAKLRRGGAWSALSG